MPVVVSLEGISKKYRTSPSRRDRLKRVLSFGKSGHEFWALKDINLDVEQGTSLGLIGRNGAGKTTLLRIISGVLQPTSGVARVSGRLIALFALGAGFNEEFTGRENVILNGLILGIDRKEILERFDEIEAFADIGDFMYQPVKTYSSGMRARLGFAVAVTVNPEILIVDEALAAGDAAFKDKGTQKMRELQDSGTTILFVSHGLDQVKEFCTEAVLLHKGMIISRGDTDQVIDQYADLISEVMEQQENRQGLEGAPDLEAAQDGGNVPGTPADSKEDPAPGGGRGTRDARLQNVELLDEHGESVNVVAPESELTVRTHVQYVKAIDESVVHVGLRNDAGLDIFYTNTKLEKVPVGSRRAGERVIVDFTFPVPLKHGRYSVIAALSRSYEELLDLTDAAFLDLTDAAFFEVSGISDREVFPGLVHLPTRVEVFEPDRAQKSEPFG